MAFFILPPRTEQWQRCLKDGLTASRRYCIEDIGSARRCRARRLSTGRHTTRRPPALLRRLVAARIPTRSSVPCAHPPSLPLPFPHSYPPVCVVYFLFYGNRSNSSHRTGTEGSPLLPRRTCTLRSRGSRTSATSEQTRANTPTFTPTWVNRLVLPPPPQPLGFYLRVLVGACYKLVRVLFQLFGTCLTGTQQPRCKTLIHARCICHRCVLVLYVAFSRACARNQPARHSLVCSSTRMLGVIRLWRCRLTRFFGRQTCRTLFWLDSLLAIPGSFSRVYRFVMNMCLVTELENRAPIFSTWLTEESFLCDAFCIVSRVVTFVLCPCNVLAFWCDSPFHKRSFTPPFIYTASFGCGTFCLSLVLTTSVVSR